MNEKFRDLKKKYGIPSGVEERRTDSRKDARTTSRRDKVRGKVRQS